MSARLVVAMPAIIRDAPGLRQRINGLGLIADLQEGRYFT
jgi:hypothetical protein